MKTLRLLKKALIYTFFAFLILIAAGGVFTYAYKDKIIALFVGEANKYLATKIAVSKVDVSIWAKFPQIAISFDNVVIDESIPGSTLPLARLKTMYFTFSPLKIITGKYEVNKVYLEEGEVTVRIDEKGQANYMIFKKDSTASTSQEPLNFNLEKINLIGVTVNYKEASMGQHYSVLAKNAAAGLNINGQDVLIAVSGKLFVNKIQLEEDIYFRQKEVDVATNLSYNMEKRFLAIAPSVLKVQGSEFAIGGTVNAKGTTDINLAVEGKHTNIQTLLSLLPASIHEKVKSYKSNGELYFKGDVKGKVSAKLAPAVNFSFGCKNASFFHPELKKTIDKANFEGQFSNGTARTASTSFIRLSKVRGLLDGKLFQGNFYMSNFSDPYLKMDLNGVLDVASVTAFYPVEQIQNASGTVGVVFDFEGRLADLKHSSRIKNVKTTGELQVTNLEFKMTGKALQFKKLNGTFIFNRNDLAISDFKGFIGRSDFELNGFFKNVIPYLLIKDQFMQMEASYKSNLLDLDELLSATGNASATSTEAHEEEYRFKVSPWLAFDLNCDVKNIKFRRLHARKLQGQLHLRNRMAHAKNISVQAMGGQIKLSGTMDARSVEAIEVQTKADLHRVYVDSAFYVFENFEQKFLQHKHLKGQLTADVESFVVFNSKLDLNAHRLMAYINASIVNGELNNFEPMMAMSRFINRKELNNMRFSELTNIIQIHDRKIYIPEMEISSNVAKLYIKGTHTFDQVMDYNVRIPLKGFIRVADKDEAFGAVEDDGTGNSNIYLTIKGTASDFKVGYDKQKVKQKIKEDLKKEKQEFLNIFKSKDAKAREVQEKEAEQPKEEEPEYFDF